jgi:hypothetical protein
MRVTMIALALAVLACPASSLVWNKLWPLEKGVFSHALPKTRLEGLTR